MFQNEENLYFLCQNFYLYLKKQQKEFIKTKKENLKSLLMAYCEKSNHINTLKNSK